MIQFDNSAPLYFVHIPRTGGTSLWEQLRTWFPDRAWAAVGRYNGMLPNPVIRHHFNRREGWSFDSYYPGGYQLITFLRDPVQRFMSWYSLWKRDRWHFQPRGGPCPQGRPHIGDHIVGNIPASARLDPETTTLSQWIETLVRFRAYPSVYDMLPYGRYPERIDTFLFVGVVEQYTRCRQALAALLKKQPNNPTNANGAAHTEQPTSEQVAFLEDYLKDEYELYDYAVKTWSPIWNFLCGGQR